MIVTAVLLLLIQAQLIGRFALRGVRYSRTLSRDRCYVGENLELIEVLENDKRLFVPWLRLESEFPASFRFRGVTSHHTYLGNVYQTHTSGFSLLPRRRVTRRHFLTCEGRGIFQLSTVFMTSGDLFGFVEQSRSENIKTPLIVYPKLLNTSQLPLSWHNWQGDLSVRRWILEDPFLIEGSREYHSGDPTNRIHWKASARTGGLQVFKQGYSADPYVMIVLDMGKVNLGAQGGGGEQEAEYAISLAATCITELIASGVAVGLVHTAHTLKENRIPPGSGSTQLQILMEALSGIRLQQKRTLTDCLIEETTYKGLTRDYLIITEAEISSFGQAYKQLENRGHKINLLDPKDRNQSSREKYAADEQVSLRKEAQG